MNPAYGFFTKLLIDSFPARKKIDLIDYGCGSGLFLDYFPKNKINNYYGYEVNDDSLKFLKSKFQASRNLKFLKLKNGSELKKSSADAVILIGVLQYLSDYQVRQLLKEANGALRKNGIILISTVVDKEIYKWPNLYRFILPNRYFDPEKLMKMIRQSGYRVVISKQRGILIAPLFSQFFIIFFDAIDKLIYRNKGRLGPIGTRLRKLFYPLLLLELKFPIDFGYTIYLKASKS